MTSRNNESRFRSTGGLLFVAAALPLLLLMPSPSSAWTSSPIGSNTISSRIHNPTSSITARIRGEMGIHNTPSSPLSSSPYQYHSTYLSVASSSTASSPEQHNPLAREGDW
eukprot:CAMPEP_0196158218 /NCGR_PEP_ID=MMETSP0910-20130528/45442_1 /TAXON_ID=49265 /ORGANISM="Thalassiosira rotula, Strain GSO102" /LENGTH=110 /DNA_ID=CAMNT_0041423073 /DNA_START=173 /DNA_END=502 /DNA_ORIENTATION=+